MLLSSSVATGCLLICVCWRWNGGRSKDEAQKGGLLLYRPGGILPADSEREALKLKQKVCSAVHQVGGSLPLRATNGVEQVADPTHTEHRDK